MQNIELIDSIKGGIKVGNLLYGTVLTNVPSNPDCMYMKVDKRELGKGLRFNYPSNSSVLVNLKMGSLRAIPGNTIVTVLDEQLTLHKTDDPFQYLKDYSYTPVSYRHEIIK